MERDMELQEAFEIMFNEPMIDAAVRSMESSREKSGEMLLEKLKERVQFLNEAPEGEGRPDRVLTKTVELLARLEVGSAFPCLVELLRSGRCCQALHPQTIFACLLALIPDANGALLLRTGVLDATICPAGREAACLAVSEFYRKTGNTQEAEQFFSDLVSSFGKEDLRDFKDYPLLFSIVHPAMELHCARLNGELKGLLIQLIIRSAGGFHASWFEDYFRCLYQLDPLIAAKIHDAKEYLCTLYRCGDREMFRFSNLEDIGNYLCAKTSGAVEGIDLDIVKIAIKQLHRYPLNDRPAPSSDGQYYREICDYLGLKGIPKEIYEQAEGLYQEVFASGFPSLRAKIEALIQKTEAKKREINQDTGQVIDEASRGHALFRAAHANMHRLARNELRIKELDSLYKKRQQEDTGMLAYTLKQLEQFAASFCEELDNQGKVRARLRDISIQCAFSESIKIEDFFSPYQRALEHLDALLAEDPRTTLQNMFYHVKFIPFAEQIHNEYKNRILAAQEGERDGIVREMRRREQRHPLHPAALIACAKKGPADYAGVLEQYSAQAIASIRMAMEHSICLKRRRAVIEHCLAMIERGEDELVINVLPVQMEGLFADLLEYTTIYKYIGNIRLYTSLFDLVWGQKFIRSEENNVNMPFDAAAYFKNYFSSVIRNTVAHGNYFLLAENSQIRGENWSGERDRDAVSRILALELLLDLNYLTGVVSEINEIDTAKRYIDYTAKQCTPVGEDRTAAYSCLFRDLNETRSRFNISKYKSGIFVTYDAQQILLWMFNPYYEQYLDADCLNTVRETVCSVGFWEYVRGRLEEPRRFGWETGTFCKTVQTMLNDRKKFLDKGLMEQAAVDLMGDVKTLLLKTS